VDYHQCKTFGCDLTQPLDKNFL